MLPLTQNAVSGAVDSIQDCRQEDASRRAVLLAPLLEHRQAVLAWHPDAQDQPVGLGVLWCESLMDQECSLAACQ